MPATGASSRRRSNDLARGRGSNVVFVKLGGSVITDKGSARAVRWDTLRRLASEIAAARREGHAGRLLIGHGSGSYGHWEAKRYGTHIGVRTAEEWRGYAAVSTAAAQLNRIVTDALATVGLPVQSIQPSASARCVDGRIIELDSSPVQVALAHGIVPVVYGDVALDCVRGGTIVSTEALFVFLAHRLDPAQIVLVGDVEGVFDDSGEVIPLISPATYTGVASASSRSGGIDVTGGMAAKVATMVELVCLRPRTLVRVVSGLVAGTLHETLCDPEAPYGTRIAADPL